MAWLPAEGLKGSMKLVNHPYHRHRGHAVVFTRRVLQLSGAPKSGPKWIRLHAKQRI